MYLPRGVQWVLSCSSLFLLAAANKTLHSATWESCTFDEHVYYWAWFKDSFQCIVQRVILSWLPQPHLFPLEIKCCLDFGYEFACENDGCIYLAVFSWLVIKSKPPFHHPVPSLLPLKNHVSVKYLCAKY